MTRTAFRASLVAVALSGGVAAAQSPAIGQLPLPGQLYGYSPLVPTIDPFPSRTSGYAPSMFLPRVGGKRVYPSLAMPARPPAAVAAPCTVPVPVLTQPGVVGPVQPAVPVRGWYRFRH